MDAPQDKSRNISWKYAFIPGLMVLFVLIYFIYRINIGPCGKPLQYSIGEFDTQFGVSKNDFIKKIIKAESVWEKPMNRNFFDYNPDATFKINLIYDQRQKEVDAKRKTEFGLSAAESSFKSLDSQFAALQSQYDARIAAHKQMIADFQARESAYESEVNSWNSQGGAPPKEYKKLQEERQAINNDIAAINNDATEVNSMLDDLNALLARRNQAARDYNKVAASYNKQYGGGIEFDQAEYTGSAINVYEFSNSDDLTIALAHELGHALGMNHVSNPKSIMYYITGEQTLSPTAEDLAELQAACHIN